MTCNPTIDRPFHCPTKWELWRQTMALLPRGRAWQTHEDGVERIIATESSQAGLFETGSTGAGTEPVTERLSVLQQYWAAFAEIQAFLHQRACALLEEFFCATTQELRAEWGAEYGFPDSCEPYDALCDKVRAEGGATCDYLAGLAARLGFTIKCSDCPDGGAAADCIVADCTPLCECTPNQITITILMRESPAAVAGIPFNADSLVADCTPVCDVVPDQVVCLIERFKPAHVRAIYIVEN